MCALCGVFVSSHWAEQGSGSRDRVLRAALLDRVAGHFGVRVSAWAGSMYVVRDRKGRSAVVPDLGSVWTAAERILGRPLDPLDPALLAALEAEHG